ncbi:DUF4132 domain-containing protein [Nocardia sp. 2]|uniref:DUF4132 domain-containing protein n=1 Tax=Nocardia acididurans TaxID=2802282 RepID=A0ABS1MEL7_9NOCA|nr:DUF4132 domain-containing protein [Nocardia acididurans]MBL1078986.1 DUF4132 domain-containing protein [Nocardia acididurans]
MARQLDEDEWVVPDSWWADAEGFRGRSPARTIVLCQDAQVIHREAFEDERIGTILHATAAAGHREIAEAGTALWEGGQATPLGAATLALITQHVGSRYGQPVGRRRLPDDRIVDAWITGHGLMFAVDSVIRLAGMTIPYQTDTHVRPLHPAACYSKTCRPILRRLRDILTELPEDDYRAVVERLSAQRNPAARSVRLAITYLAPAQQDWLDDDLAAGLQFNQSDRDDAWLGMVASATTLAQVTALWHPDGRMLAWPSSRATVTAVIGPELATLVAEALDKTGSRPDMQRELADLLAQFPTDEAFDLLLDRIDRKPVRGALQDAITRFPRRALRMLAARSARSTVVAGLLRTQTHTHPEIAAELGIVADAPRGTVACDGIATPDELPEFLRTPPWEQPKPSADEIVLRGLGTARPIELSWQAGEQELWADTPTNFPEERPDSPAAQDWDTAISAAIANVGNAPYTLVRLFATAPTELVAPHLDLLEPDHFWSNTTGMMRLLGRFGDRVLPLILAAVRRDPAQRAEVLAPATGTEITAFMAGLLGKPTTARIAVPWLERHHARAAADLVSTALDKPTRPRKTAWAALHLLARRGYRDSLIEAAAVYGEQAVAALEIELIADPLHHLPAKIPALPSWLIPAALPPIVLRHNRTALPDSVVATVCTTLAIAEQQGGYPGVDLIAQAADPASLAEFTWALLESWRVQEYPPTEGWIMRALAEYGDDETARKLTPLIRAWPGESAHQRAVRGLNVLAAIGTDLALMQLNGIAEKVKFNGIKTLATEKIARIAQERGLSTEQLGDRLVPDLGLRQDGTLYLDYGPRAFVIGLDEQLRPTINDAGGAARKTLPKPGASDDPELAPTAHRAFAAFKKDVKAVAGIQLRRLEEAMVLGRRWTAAEHRQLFIEHPLIGRLTRRLVWATFDADGAVTGSFRVAEDGSLADARDDELSFPEDTTVGVAHPLHLGDTRSAWGEIFADYELLQPFPQLDRETHRLTDAEAAAHRLDRLERIEVPAGNPMRLVARGWEREEPQGNGDIDCLFRVFGDGRSFIVCLEPGYSAAMPPDIRGDHQALDRIWLGNTGEEHRYWRDHITYPLGTLDPVTASELLRDLEYVFA